MSVLSILVRFVLDFHSTVNYYRDLVDVISLDHY